MFEDALVESTARIRTRTRYWMIATFTFNAALVATLSIVPLLFPQALPKTSLTSHFTLPQPPLRRAPQVQHASNARTSTTPSHTVPLDPTTAPRQIPTHIADVKDPPPAGVAGSATGPTMGSDNGIPGGIANALNNNAPRITVMPPQSPPKPAKVSGGVMTGQLINQVQPLYPTIARAARVQGTVVLHAIISKNGTIENLSVLSGSDMLRNAALDAVRQWRYRPYLLTGQPTEVETTITVNFTLGG